jgi:glycosyltransferase involved in cell wall biosynthesis
MFIRGWQNESQADSDVEGPMPEPPLRHILIVVENLPVPLDRRVWLEATTLVRAGYQVSIISPMGQGWVAPFERREGVDIYRYPAAPETGGGAVSYAREYASAIWHWFRLARRIWRQNPFQAIHGCNPPDLICLLAMWYRRKGVSYVYDQHDVCPELFVAKFNRQGVGYGIMRKCELLSYGTASVVISPNQSFRDIAMARGGKHANDIFIVRSAPKLTDFIPGAGVQAYRREGVVLLGYVGVIGQQEGMDLLLCAADHLVTFLGIRNIHFLIIGFGPALPDMKRQVDDLGLGSYFTFTGALYGRALVDALNSMDIGLAPDPCNAMNDISSMNKVVEYMALGKPVVQFDLTEGRRTAENASLYAASNDPVRFAECIKQLIDNPSLRAAMGKAGRERVVNTLAWSSSEPHLLAAYTRLCDKRMC